MQHVWDVSSRSPQPDDEAIAQAAQILLNGGLALIPTETVYGLSVAVAPLMHHHAQAGGRGIKAPETSKGRERGSGEALTADGATASGGAPAADEKPAVCDTAAVTGVAAQNDTPCVNGALIPPAKTGYRRIFTVKHRNPAQTVPWLVSGVEALDTYGRDIDPVTRALAEAFWPGALTLIVRAQAQVPAYMQASDGTVALRCSASPVVAKLIEACQSPLATTSANTHGAPAPTSFTSVEPTVLAGVDIALDAGETPCQDASTIVSCVNGTPSIIRVGALAPEAIKQVADAALTKSAQPPNEWYHQEE